MPSLDAIALASLRSQIALVRALLDEVDVLLPATGTTDFVVLDSVQAQLTEEVLEMRDRLSRLMPTPAPVSAGRSSHAQRSRSAA